MTVTSEVKGQVFAIDTIMYNGDPNKLINMVFMSDGFQAAELPDYKTKVQNLSNYLFTISPFNFHVTLKVFGLGLINDSLNFTGCVQKLILF